MWWAATAGAHSTQPVEVSGAAARWQRPMRGFSTAAARAQGSLDGPFLAKLGAVCFAVGAGMELFMIKVG